MTRRNQKIVFANPYDCSSDCYELAVVLLDYAAYNRKGPRARVRCLHDPWGYSGIVTTFARAIQVINEQARYEYPGDRAKRAQYARALKRALKSWY